MGFTSFSDNHFGRGSVRGRCEWNLEWDRKEICVSNPGKVEKFNGWSWKYEKWAKFDSNFTFSAGLVEIFDFLITRNAPLLKMWIFEVKSEQKRLEQQEISAEALCFGQKFN